jgi:endonuclease/exonuclease/phosphatase (EEP) superfamily protein YafD
MAIILRWGALLLIAAYVLAIAVLQVLWRTSALNIWWLSLLNVFGLWLYVPLPFLFLIGLLAYPRATWLLIVPLLCFGWEYAPWPRAAMQQAPGSSLRVMSWNVLFANPNVDAIDAVIREHNPDIVALQEYGFVHARGLEAVLNPRYPYQALAPGGPSGLGVWSRYPILEWDGQADRLDPCKCQRLTLDIGGQNVRLVNAHPLAPRFTFRRELAGVRLPWELPSDFVTEHQQPAFDVLVREATRADEPMILVGDLNVNDRQPNYWRLRRYLDDAYREAGRGFGLTFPSTRKKIGSLTVPLLVRIDYIFHSRSISAVRAWNDASPYSDHRAVIADLQVPAQAHAFTSSSNGKPRSSQ